MARQAPTAHFIHFTPTTRFPLVFLIRKKKKNARGNGSRIQRTLHHYQSIDQFPGLFKFSYPCPAVQRLDKAPNVVSRNVQDNISDQWWGFLEFPEVDRWRWSRTDVQSKSGAATENPKKRTPRPISHPCDVICRAVRSIQMCWILYTCIEHSVLHGVRSTYIVLCYIHMLNWLYIVDLLQCRTHSHLRVFLTPPAKWSPSPPWMGVHAAIFALRCRGVDWRRGQ